MSNNKSSATPRNDHELLATFSDPRFSHDLVRFVKLIFPWGKPGTPLEKFKEPRTWQIDELHRISEHIKKNKERIALGLDPRMYQSATVSGRGPGKSALVSWLNLWMMSTNLGSTSINTANTEEQLKSKTWAELGKWHTLALNCHWFEKMALSLKPSPWFEDALKRQLKVDTGYYYAAAQLWNEDHPDSFAGAHNYNGILLIFDEASGIPKPIWTVAEGFFTEPALHRYWFVFSNGRRNTGPFFECFHKDRDFWNRRQIDSRDVEGTDKDKLNEIITKHGEDSDEARVEVKGQFPRQGDKQFIAREIVQDSMDRTLEEDPHAAMIMGVDVARFGDDSSVLCFRQGRDARTIPMVVVKGLDNMQLANLCAMWIDKVNPDAVCIDAGNGTGVIDRLREMKYKVNEVWFGGKSFEPEYMNLRTYMWAQIREWCRGGCLPSNSELKVDLTAPEYKFVGAGDVIRLETKEELKKRGFASPDRGDALACTFAVKVARRDMNAGTRMRGSRIARDMDYSIFG